MKKQVKLFMLLALGACLLFVGCTRRARRARQAIVVVDYCAIETCVPVDVPPVDAKPISWCCDYETGDCVAVITILACDPELEYAVYCEWGQTVPQSSSTGTIDCFG